MLKASVIGVGHLGKIHARLLKENHHFQLAGVYDILPDKAQKFATEIECHVFENLQEAVAQADVVIIVTPTASHCEIATYAMQQGKHVFIEKPVTLHRDEINALVACQNHSRVKVQVGHVERFNPAFLIVQHQINQPRFIETHRLAQFNPRGTDVSVVLDLMVHDLDIVYAIVQSKVKNILANAVAIVSDTPDIANARIEFENGCVANLTASRISLKNMRKTRVFQSDAYISIDFLNKKSEVIKIDSNVDESNPFALILDLHEKGKRQITIKQPKLDAINSIVYEHQLFKNAITENKEPVIGLQQAKEVMEIAFGVMEKCSQ
ncbi:MAG: Gfo/Idh/MocA family oxidoreductase [Bacteroidetes bacterium]|nr:Gfo/Idh/MocA family oxidoreductase [Bacteroidota bacterium]